MKNTNRNYAINQVIWPPKFGDLKLPEPKFAQKIGLSPIGSHGSNGYNLSYKTPFGVIQKEEYT